MEEQGGERAHDEHEGKRAKREHERGRRVGLGERGWSPGEIAEDEGGSGLRRALQDFERAIQGKDRVAKPRHEEQQRREHDLQSHARGDHAPMHAAAVLGQQPRERDEDCDSREGVGDVHGARHYPAGAVFVVGRGRNCYNFVLMKAG